MLFATNEELQSRKQERLDKILALSCCLNNNVGSKHNVLGGKGPLVKPSLDSGRNDSRFSLKIERDCRLKYETFHLDIFSKLLI